MSKKQDLMGAPASNAGDTFHETWALREALRLLDPTSGLTALYVEGVRDSAETDDAANWDGVDCALYYDNTNDPNASRVELVQVKYSVASPTKSWTPVRFCKSTKNKGNNSVARRLANAFKGVTKGKTYEQVRKSICVYLVTNQPIAKTLLDEIDKAARGDLKGTAFDRLQKATGLARTTVKLFCECLTLKGAEESRDTLSAKTTLMLSELLQAPPADTTDGLLMKIRRCMMPEGSRGIDKAVVIGWFGLGQEEALFPREPRLEPLGALIPRVVTGDLANAVVAHPLVCLHGDGGCGKTTIARTLEAALPSGSRAILYDCYGAGAYRDQSQPRHRPFEAFMQLSNELARVTNTPLFFPYSNRPDMASAFRKKLVTAAQIFAAERPGALLVILIDAADNAVHAATSPTPPQECFVHQLVTFSELPPNVRIVISSRTARRKKLHLPEDTVEVLCPPFSLDETGDFLALHKLTGPDSAVEDFHELSTHNPRVQSNAIEASNTLADAIGFLLPNGKSLPALFDAMIDKARNRAGVDTSRARLGAALTTLPTPVPIAYLASVCDLDEAVCRDLVIELTQRNVRLSDRGVELANEDFEDYCEKTGQSEVSAAISKVADLLMKDRLTSEYAATHLFEILVQAERKVDLQTCLDEPEATSAIADPVKRRQVELSRIRAALHVAALSGDDISIGKTIYVGAESLPSAGKVKQVMRDNPDLSAAFVPDTICPLVLNDPEVRYEHGLLLMHLCAEHARKGEFFEARMRRRAAEEWLQTLFRMRDSVHGPRWSFEDHDIVATKMAAFLDGGWPLASRQCDWWSPKSYAIQLRAGLLRQIALEKGPDAIAALVAQVEPDYLFLALNALVRAGRCPAGPDLAKALTALNSTRFEDFGQNERGAFKMTTRQRLVDEVLFFLDYASRESGLETDCLQVLDKLSSPGPAELEGISLSQPYAIDVALRAAILHAHLTHQPLDFVSVYPEPEEPVDKDPNSEARLVYNRLKKKREDVDKLIAVYEVLAVARLHPSEKAWESLTGKLVSLREHIRDPVDLNGVRRLVGRRALELLAIQDAARADRLRVIQKLAYDPEIFTDAHGEWLPDLLHDPRSHEPVTKLMEAQAAALVSRQMKATDKAEGLISIARIFLFFHRPNAEAYFNQALQIVEEVDLETLDVLHALCRMIQRPQPDTLEARARTSRFARLVHIAGDLLQSEDGFPQEEAVRALAASCPPVAAATVSRWTDEGFSTCESDLKTFTECSLDSGLLTPYEALLLSGLISSPITKLETKILKTAPKSASSEATYLAEEIAHSKLLAMAPGANEDDCEDLCVFSATSGKAPESWSKIEEIQTFKTAHADALKPPDKPKSEASFCARREDKKPPDWSEVDPCDPVALEETQRTNRDAGIYDQVSFLAVMRAKIRIADRQRHLDTLAAMVRNKRYADEEIKAILAALKEWTDAAVRKWRRDVLPDLIVDLGYKALGYDWYAPSAIDPFLEACEANDVEIRKLIVKLIATHAFNLGARSLLKLLAHFVRRLPQEDANTLIDFFLDRLETRLKLKDMDLSRYAMDTASLPETGAEITAALLYRYLGDVDARLRWRAAHVLRQAAKIGAGGLVGNVLSTALLETQLPYTFGDCPFHGLSADLQLAITLARLSYEEPILIAENEALLTALWKKRAPHLLIGHYLSRALKRARDAGKPIRMSLAELADMTGEMAVRKPKVKGAEKRQFERFEAVGERFNFDSMDAISYWYNPVLEMFTDLSQETLIGTAEKWIVDKWGGHEKSGHWDNEPRPRRLRENYNLYSNSHGSLPTLERHWHYLQLHGLFAAVGELIKTHSLCVPKEEDSWNTFESWLSRYDTTYAGIWIADIRSLPPLDVRYWRLPQPESSDWLEETQTCYLSKECMAENGAVILSSHREIRTYSYGDEAAYETVYSKAAFVPSETAAALLRAFAATSDPRDVYLPDSNWISWEKPHDPRFLLTNAIATPLEHRDSGLDAKDPTRYDVRGVLVIPSPELKAATGLIENDPWSTEWLIDGCSSPAAVYTTWSSLPNEEHDPRRRQSNKTYVDGYRLTLDPIILKAAMETLGCDLIVSVHITRSSGDRYAKKHNRKQNEEQRTEAFLFRRDGRIETASGDPRTWAKTNNPT